MTFADKLLFLVGIAIAVFGFVFVLGGTLLMLDPDSEHSALELVAVVTLMGIVPLGGGIGLCRRVRVKAKARKSESHERELLQLAGKNGGRLTVAQVAMSMAVSAEQAKALLDKCHLNSLAEIEISESGAVVYRFKLT